MPSLRGQTLFSPAVRPGVAPGGNFTRPPVPTQSYFQGGGPSPYRGAQGGAGGPPPAPYEPQGVSLNLFPEQIPAPQALMPPAQQMPPAAGMPPAQQSPPAAGGNPYASAQDQLLGAFTQSMNGNGPMNQAAREQYLRQLFPAVQPPWWAQQQPELPPPWWTQQQPQGSPEPPWWAQQQQQQPQGLPPWLAQQGPQQPEPPPWWAQ
jgi:hypothetical protein